MSEDKIKSGETKSVDEVTKAAREAGHQLAGDGKISEEIQKKVNKVLISRDAYLKQPKR